MTIPSARSLVWIGAWVLVLGLAGCAQGTGMRTTRGTNSTSRGDGGVVVGGGDSGEPNGSRETGALCNDRRDNDGDGRIDCDDSDCASTGVCTTDSGVAPVNGCDDFDVEGVVAQTDVIWIIDNSGSMGEEAAFIQQGMNGFVQAINGSGVDTRVVVITDPGMFGLMFPAPLGNDPNRLRVVPVDVQSTNAFAIATASFEVYRDFLRPGATTHVVVVSDDESDSPWANFRSTMESNLGHSFIFHAIVSPPGSPPGNEFLCGVSIGFAPYCGCGVTLPNGLQQVAAQNSEIYWAAAQETGGEQLSICEPDWSPLFAALSRSVQENASLPCDIALQEAPMGEAFDYPNTFLDWTSRNGDFARINRLDAPSECGDQQGWTFDDAANPTQIRLCPASCNSVQTSGGRIDVTYTCLLDF